MTIEIVRNILHRNQEAAAENRALFEQHGIRCINLLGGAGSGKTALLEALLPELVLHARTAVMEGDLTTTRDAERIAALNVPVVQLLTDGGCHLSAALVEEGLRRLPIDELDLVIIENVGNPICPANFDLGEHARISVLSVSEGDDKPSKYPLLFRDAGLVVLTKRDLLPYTDFDIQQVLHDLERINPNANVIVTSARKKSGTAQVAEWIVGSMHRTPNDPGLIPMAG